MLCKNAFYIQNFAFFKGIFDVFRCWTTDIVKRKELLFMNPYFLSAQMDNVIAILGAVDGVNNVIKHRWRNKIVVAKLVYILARFTTTQPCLPILLWLWKTRKIHKTIYTLHFLSHFFKTSKKLSYNKSMGIDTESLTSYDFVWLTKTTIRYIQPIVYMSWGCKNEILFTIYYLDYTS